jgi:UDP-3-O-[3-hydroxymyristoyl] glucosamine N-acyltransferase
MIKKKLAELAVLVEAKIEGDAEVIISGVGSLASAHSGQISFFDNLKYRSFLKTTQASAVILKEAYVKDCPVNVAKLIVTDSYYAYAKIAGVFEDLKPIVPGIQATAVIGEGCHIDSTASIGAHVVIGDGVTVGARTCIDPGCYVGDRCVLGSDCHLWSNVTLYHQVTLGNRVMIQSGAVIGSDGFGFAFHAGVWHRVPQLGGVLIQDDADIGANTTIDRGAIEDTVIGQDVKLDNLIQIGHNVRVGDHTIMAGCTGIAGSTELGKYCMLGGGCRLAGHIKIADGVILTGTASVMKSIAEKGMYSSGMSCMKHSEWKRNMVRFRHLDQMMKPFLKNQNINEKEKEDDTE